MSTSELAQLYQEELLALAKDGSHRCECKDFTHFNHGKNPLCGDTVEIYFRVDQGKIQKVCHAGDGCAISQASAALVAQVLEGQLLDAALEAIETISSELAQETKALTGMPAEVLRILGGVRKFPVRLRCALLAWKSAELALKGS
ncbi:SUF system NifU family Fe-S cluster assembly protein [bacterium]|nr:SUF system NifU family Fe-S cluster assembly protein [bacterium]